MTSPADQRNGAAYGLVKFGFKAQTPTNGTAIAGAIFDRNALGLANSMEVTHNFVYTTAGGDATGIITCLTEVYSDTASNMATETLLKSKSVAITWASDAAGKTFCVTVPVNLSPAKRYVRAKFTHTKAGTVTVSAQIVSQTVRFSGMQAVPHSTYVDAGYFASTDTSV